MCLNFYHLPLRGLANTALAALLLNEVSQAMLTQSVLEYED